jgi:hypothetical protein
VRGDAAPNEREQPSAQSRANGASAHDTADSASAAVSKAEHEVEHGLSDGRSVSGSVQGEQWGAQPPATGDAATAQADDASAGEAQDAGGSTAGDASAVQEHPAPAVEVRRVRLVPAAHTAHVATSGAIKHLKVVVRLPSGVRKEHVFLDAHCDDTTGLVAHLRVSWRQGKPRKGERDRADDRVLSGQLIVLPCAAKWSLQRCRMVARQQAVVLTFADDGTAA